MTDQAKEIDRHIDLLTRSAFQFDRLSNEKVWLPYVPLKTTIASCYLFLVALVCLINETEGESFKNLRAKKLASTKNPAKAKRRGVPAPSEANKKRDRTIFDLWASGEYPTYQAMAQKLGIPEYKARQIVDRHRKRMRRTKSR